MPTISFRDVSVRVATPAPRTIVQSLSLELTEHRIGIIGANGSGKSTFVRLINGLTSPSTGTVTVDDVDVSRHAKQVRQRVGFIFSDADNQILMPTVAEDIAFSLRRLKLGKAETQRRTQSVMDRLGLAHLVDASPHTLSGGEKQLLALASVLVMEPSVIIADEPTTLLDLRNRRRVAQAFAELEQQMIVVTHDLDLVEDFDRVLCFDDSELVADSLLNPTPQRVITNYRISQEAR